jgi:hypothetical protein
VLFSCLGVAGGLGTSSEEALEFVRGKMFRGLSQSVSVVVKCSIKDRLEISGGDTRGRHGS